MSPRRSDERYSNGYAVDDGNFHTGQVGGVLGQSTILAQSARKKNYEIEAHQGEACLDSVSAVAIGRRTGLLQGRRLRMDVRYRAGKNPD